MPSSASSSFDTLRLEGLFVALGLVLLLGGVLVGFTGLTDTYKHEVREVSESDQELPSGEHVLSSKDLTLTEQAVLLEAITSESPAWTTSPVGLEFSYPESPDSTTYTIELDGTLYVLETSTDERPTMMVASGVRVSLVFSGLLLLAAGAVPIFHVALGTGEPFSPPLDSLFQTWIPTWALMMLAPSAALVLVSPILFETLVSVPLNLFLAPFSLTTALCTAVTMLALRPVSLPDAFVLASAVNVPVVWTLTVALVVAPTSGESQAILTLLLGLASLSVLVGQVLGWYTLRWLEVRRRRPPHSPTYWQI